MNFCVLKGSNIYFDIKILQRGRCKKWFVPPVTKQKIKRVVAFIAPAGISPRGEIPRRHPIARAYIKDSTYSSNIQSVYRKNLDLFEQGPRGIGR